MKRLAIGLALAFIAMPAVANEVTCGENEMRGMALDISTGITSYVCSPRAVYSIPVAESTPERSSSPSPAPINEPTPELTPSTETSTVTIEPPAAWQAPEKSNVVVVNASTNEAIVREETVDEYMSRVIWSWNYWWEALLKWFASLNEK